MKENELDPKMNGTFTPTSEGFAGMVWPSMNGPNELIVLGFTAGPVGLGSVMFSCWIDNDRRHAA